MVLSWHSPSYDKSVTPGLKLSEHTTASNSRISFSPYYLSAGAFVSRTNGLHLPDLFAEMLTRYGECGVYVGINACKDRVVRQAKS
jgi:hypothetical protein